MNLLAQINCFFLVCILSFWHSLAHANLGIAFSSGQGIHDIVPYRLSVSWDFGPILAKDSLWGLNATWENSFAFWNGPRRADLATERATDLSAATTGPMLKWQRRHAFPGTHIIPYAELGVGVSYLSQTEIQGRVLSLHFPQFEDKGGIGVRFGTDKQYDIALRVYHYSNASIKRPNSGVNLAMVSFGFWLPS